MKLKKAIILIPLLLVAIVAIMFVTEAAGEHRPDGALKLATEYPSPDEAEAIQDIIDNLETILNRRHLPPKRMPRDAHLKQHGLVKAEFTVLDTFDERYKIGVFSEPKTYEAWVRFSNNFDKPDFIKNTRGMAVKLMGVEGQKILPKEANATTHDFVFMSQQYFPTKDAISFAELLRGLEGGKIALARYLITHPHVAIKFKIVDTIDPDLFSIVWGSATPYALGDDIAVKYIAKSRDASTETLPSGEISPDFLRERLAARLAQEDVLIDFYIQPQTDANAMPIEDARKVWDQKLSPHIKVATIRIPKQIFDTPAQHLYGDQLSYTPWHALPEHRPLGGINRGRKVIYTAISEFRHGRNGEVPLEPTDWSDFSAE